MMRTQTWLSVFLTCSCLISASCGDDVTVTMTDTTGSTGSSGGDETTTDVADTGSTTDEEQTDSTGPVMACGDGILEVPEACDDGNNEDDDGCSADCIVEEGYLCQGQPSECLVICGDGIIVGDEECDDDNVLQGDGCSIDCQIEEGYDCDGMEPTACETICGDGLLAGTENCDDENTEDGDGCSAECSLEDGFDCMGLPTVCEPVCGDGQVLGDEECDDVNIVPDDGCSPDCTIEPGWSCMGDPSVCMTGCGDGVIAGTEQCDDMNMDEGDGCSASCQLESGWVCMDEPSLCATDCGDGLIAGVEQCDDGGVSPGDGCSDTCQIEFGHTCDGEPSVCVTDCGDGVVVGVEVCDDGNIAQGDGCSLTCEPEFGWDCVGEPSVCTLTDVLDRVALGIDGGCVMTTLGNVGCFGLNQQGEVGIGFEDVEIHIPAYTIDGAIALTSGEEFNCIVRGDGSAWCWGDNTEEQMGPGGVDNVDEFFPIEVTGMPPLTDINAGDDHVCAVDTSGDLWCWGDNTQRQLGHGGADTVDDPIPTLVPMPGGLSVIDLGMGDDHSCVVLSDNTVACWGDDDGGQLGDGASGTDSGTPAVVPGLAVVNDVEGGSNHTCARTDLGEMYCWGDNIDGQLGNGNTTDSANPLLVPLPMAVDDITLGDDFTCALLVDDSVYCWGEGSDFQIGGGNYVDRLNPGPVPDVPAVDLVDIEAGGRGVCVISAAAERYCWGYSENALLGIAPHDQLEPSPTTFSGPVQELYLSPVETNGAICGRMADDSIECAGDGTMVSTSTISGSSGLFDPITYHLATPTPMTITDVQDMAIGNSFACAATTTNVQCWGDNSQRQLGQGGTSTLDILTPSPVMGLGVVDQIEAGSGFACARTGSTVQCWGDNLNRQTGEDATTTDQSLPVTVMGLVDVVDIALGEAHSCALTMGGTVSCWGDDASGQLGDDDADPADSAIPVPVAGLPMGVEQIDLGQDHACALAAGEVYCWGEGSDGRLGQGDELDSDMAVQVPGVSGIVQIAIGYRYSCALDGVGEMTCWGYAQDGQLGNGGLARTGIIDQLDPIPFSVASGITDVRAANRTICVELGGTWQCLGFRGAGQLGNGTSLEPATPTLMVFGL